MRDFLFGEAMRAVTTALLGDDVFLFNEQWVVKGAEEGMKFAWHQDSGYVYSADAEARYSGWTPGQYVSILGALIGVGVLGYVLTRRDGASSANAPAS